MKTKVIWGLLLVTGFQQLCYAEKSDIIEKCTKAEISALFGANGQGCLFYDFTTKEGGFETKFCAGLYLSEGAKIGVGAKFEVSVDQELQYCLKWTESSKKPPGELDFSDKALRERLEKVIKSNLEKASDEELKKFGIERKDIGKIKNIKLGPPIDGTSRKKEIEKQFEKCKPLEIKRVS